MIAGEILVLMENVVLQFEGDERARLLQSLGLTPEIILASSGLLDRTTLLALLQAVSGWYYLFSYLELHVSSV